MFRVPEHLRSTRSEDGRIVLDVKRGCMFGLNIVGSRIIDLLEQGYALEQIAKDISSAFGVALELADHDVREFLDTLEKHQLIEQRVTDALA